MKRRTSDSKKKMEEKGNERVAVDVEGEKWVAMLSSPSVISGGA